MTCIYPFFSHKFMSMENVKGKKTSFSSHLCLYIILMYNSEFHLHLEQSTRSNEYLLILFLHNYSFIHFFSKQMFYLTRFVSHSIYVCHRERLHHQPNFAASLCLIRPAASGTPLLHLPLFPIHSNGRSLQSLDPRRVLPAYTV